MLRVLALSGSLRANSSNSALLMATERLAPPGMSIEHYDSPGSLPHFNPDLEDHLPQPVVELRSMVARSDGLLISCPEYARGIPGSFKNALDWLVGSTDFPGKPVMLFNASPRASDAQAALRLVLQTMSAYVVEEASISVDLLAKGCDPQAIAVDPALSLIITNALDVFMHRVTSLN